MSERAVAIVAGARTPFVKRGRRSKILARNGLPTTRSVDWSTSTALTSRQSGLSSLELSFRSGVNRISHWEIVFETELPAKIEAQTISSYCITGLRSVTAIAEGVASGRIEAGIAGGVDSLSHADPDTFREPSLPHELGTHPNHCALFGESGVPPPR